MNATEVLARLTAVLDEDERIATAACDAARGDTDGDAGEWFTDDRDADSAGVTSGAPQRYLGDPPGPAHGVVVYSEGFPHVQQAQHIARHDPNRVLRQVARDRRVLARHQPYELDASIIPLGPGGIGSRGPFCIGCGHRGNGVGPLPWPCVEIRELIEVYGKKTAEVKA